MSEPLRTDYYGLAVAAALDGDNIALQVARDAAALRLAANPAAPPLARVLANVAAATLQPAEAELMIASDPSLTQAVVALESAQIGELSIGQIAGRDIITINVYAGTATL
jgi:hypothetical protein